jgi:ABC-type glycerol-3-phosphate transport system substrate-binding protein
MSKVKILSLIAIIFIIIMVIMSGCKTTSKETTQESITEETTQESITEETTQESITINLWGYAGIENDWWQEIMDMYMNEHPNVTLEYTPQADLLTLVPSALASGAEKMDATFLNGGGRVDDFAREGLLLNLDSYYDKYNWYDQMPAGVKACKTPGFGMAFYPTDGFVLNSIYYNPRIFEEVGVDIPTTLDELIKIADKIKAAGYIPFAASGKEAGYAGLVLNQLFGRFMSEEDATKLIMWSRDPNKSKETAEIFRSQGVIKALEYFKKIVVDNGPEGVASVAFSDAKTLFIQEKAAMHPDASWAIGIIKEQAADFDFKYFDMPSNDGKDILCATYTNGWVVPSYVSEEKIHVIMDIFNSVLKKEYAIKAFDHGLTSVSSNVTFEDMEGKVDPMIIAQMDTLNKKSYIEQFEAMSTPDRIQAWYNTLSTFMLGESTAEEAAESLYQAALNELGE